jgi:signal transduction histidine kinase
MTDTMTQTPARTLVLLRIVTLYPVALAWDARPPTRVDVALALALVASTSVLALRWSVVVPLLRRHPGIAAADVAVSLLVLAQAGADSPFVAYTMTSAVLIGLLFTRVGAGLLTALLCSGYLLLTLRIDAGPTSRLAPLGVPVAYALLAVAGQAFRGLHERLRWALDATVSAERSAATARERNRLARDLHDGVSSTLQGLVLQATAVSRAATGADARVSAQAGALADAARRALAESREVLNGLREEDDDGPLVQAAADRAQRWSRSTGIAVTFSTSGVVDVRPAARIAALRVLDEALRNVQRHSGASTVSIQVVGDERTVRLVVRDDGHGLPADRPGACQGHYGVLGMTERATAAGGSLTLRDATSGDARPGDARSGGVAGSGAMLRLELPQAAAGRLPEAAR